MQHASSGRDARAPARRRPVVVVVSDQPLIAETVAAALVSRGVDASVGSWPAPGAPADVGLALVESERADLVAVVRTLVDGSDGTRWIVLTAAPRGPLWGAALETGATLVLPRTASLEETVGAVGAVARGMHMRAADKAALTEAWDLVRTEQEGLVEAMASLTARERDVLELLYEGMAVPEVAEELGLTVATVRHHVRSMLRKLGVSSQLAAVARFAQMLGLVGDGRDGRPPR